MATSPAPALVVTIEVRWWLPIYLATLLLLCRMFGAQPHPSRVSYWVSKGLRVTVKSSQQGVA